MIYKVEIEGQKAVHIDSLLNERHFHRVAQLACDELKLEVFEKTEILTKVSSLTVNEGQLHATFVGMTTVSPKLKSMDEETFNKLASNLLEELPPPFRTPIKNYIMQETKGESFTNKLIALEELVHILEQSFKQL